jgi:Ca2+-binding RTX toxin-like protein
MGGTMSLAHHPSKIEPLEPRRLLAASAILSPDGTLTVTGTGGDDVIELLYLSPAVRINGVLFDFDRFPDPQPIHRTVVKALGGDDNISVAEGYAGTTPVTVDAGTGNDIIGIFDSEADVIGGRGNDTMVLSGFARFLSFNDEAGNDTLDLNSILEYGGIGGTLDIRPYPDLENVVNCPTNVIGNDQANYITFRDDGATGVFFQGGRGNDTLVGGSGNDTLSGDAGKDLLIGNGGDDVFLARDNKKDKIIGGDGFDSASVDKKDKRDEVEILLA